ncbi:GNAT family N-acetyltransferase [Levilactobacillus lindianensis]|uniref:GNAT family N-acetyltransferase n=1 Tax=Levilactobacillus lindianensis TaxID=2486018 RepID=UPI000F73D017|nr:GNAT family N-acetyltransferase [Levilactobacillus lindianensis]
MITYQMDAKLDAANFKDLLVRTELHRQINDDQKLQGMLDHADFLYTAWDGDKVVGYVRGLTDYADVIYIADLAVDADYRHQGIARHLLGMVQDQLGQTLHTVLLASLYAKDFYAKIGFTKDSRGYVKNPQHLDPADWTV